MEKEEQAQHPSSMEGLWPLVLATGFAPLQKKRKQNPNPNPKKENEDLFWEEKKRQPTASLVTSKGKGKAVGKGN